MAHATRLEINYDNIRSFENLFEDWLVQLEHYLQELIQAIQCNSSISGETEERQSNSSISGETEQRQSEETEERQSGETEEKLSGQIEEKLSGETEKGRSEEAEERHKQLISNVLAHYTDYFSAKARVTEENVFLLFSASWLSSYERMYSWMTGYRPVVACKLVSRSISDLTEEQLRKINSLTVETRQEEAELSNGLTRLQQYMITPQMILLATQMGRLQNGALANKDSLVERMRTSMEFLVTCADQLRKNTVTKILEILNISQSLKFLTAVTQFQLAIRRHGASKDASFNSAT